MEIIKCSMEHLDCVADLYDKVTAYLVRTINYPKWIPGKYPGRESTKRAISDNVQYACIKDGKVVGAFILNDDPQGNYSVGDWRQNLSDGEYMVIHTLASDPDTYQMGVGKCMVSYCINKARELGFKAVRLDVVPGNLPAIRLYEKFGFTFAGEKDICKNIKEIPLFDLFELNF